MVRLQIVPNTNVFGTIGIRDTIQVKRYRKYMSFAQFIERTKVYNTVGHFPPYTPKEITIYEVLDHTACAKLHASWGM